MFAEPYGPYLQLRGTHGGPAVLFWQDAYRSGTDGKNDVSCIRGERRIVVTGTVIPSSISASRIGGALTMNATYAGEIAADDVAELSRPGWECRWGISEGPLAEVARAEFAAFHRLLTGPRPAACGPGK